MFYSLECLICLCHEQAPYRSYEELLERATELRRVLHRFDAYWRRSQRRQLSYYLEMGKEPNEFADERG